MKKLFALLALASITQIASSANIEANVDAAKNKVAMCIGCHAIPGYKASFPEVYQVPMIGGQNAAYIENALKAYRKGDRKHPSMRGIAGGLSDQDIVDIAAYYAKQSPNSGAQSAPKSAEVVGDSVMKKFNCATCHGAAFNQPIDPSYPKLAGQHKDYLVQAISAYKRGGVGLVGRNHPIMADSVKDLSKADIESIANYVSRLSGDLVIKK